MATGTRWRSWLRHCAKSWKVAGSIPNGVIRSFHLLNPSDRTVSRGSTQSLTEMSKDKVKGTFCRITSHERPEGE